MVLLNFNKKKFNNTSSSVEQQYPWDGILLDLIKRVEATAKRGQLRK